MMTLDTNVLVRILIDDQEVTQMHAARKLVQKAKHVFIPQIVQVELIWVLVRAYDLKKPQVITILNELSHNAAFILQDEDMFAKALEIFENNTMDFSDCLIYAVSDAKQCLPLYTFDKKLLTLDNTRCP